MSEWRITHAAATVGLTGNLLRRIQDDAGLAESSADSEVVLSDSAAQAPATFSCARRQLLLAGGAGGVALLAACGSSSKSATSAPTDSSAAGSPRAAASSAPASSGGATVKGIIALADVPTDTAVSVKDSTGRTLLLTQSGGKLTALDSTCTHMACTVAPDGGKLQCPCHGSEYTLTGAVTQGPAPSALKTVAVKVTSGQVVLA